MLKEAGMMDGEDRLISVIWKSPVLHCLLARWSAVALPDGWLSGSAIAQTLWNDAYGFPADHGLADIDLVYFDGRDLSAEGEERQAERVRSLFPDLPLRIDVKNEARVHLWYQSRFGYAIPPYASVEQAIATFPTTAGAVAVRAVPAGLEIFAPFGLTDMLNGTVRPNKAQIRRAIYEAKIARWRTCWPDLNILPWDEDDSAFRGERS